MNNMKTLSAQNNNKVIDIIQRIDICTPGAHLWEEVLRGLQLPRTEISGKCLK